MPKKISTPNNKELLINNPVVLYCLYILVLMAPSIYFACTHPLDIVGKIIILLFPMSIYTFVFALPKNPGACYVVGLPLLVLNAFQIVLFFLFGDDVIAADMFLNVVTTNASEINELLSSLLPSILLVILLYLPALILAIRQWNKKIDLNWSIRKYILSISAIVMILTIVMSFKAENKTTNTFVFIEDMYPINGIYNLGFAVNKWDKIKRYPQTSEGFTFDATREKTSSNRQIIVLIIGETSRADNWSLYGYDRLTNPKLSKQENLIPFKDAITQSNTTHKSVSMILSDVDAHNYNTIYHKKGVIEAFKEAGFKTICLTNQAENSSFIEYFTKEADIYKTIRKKDNTLATTENNFDEELIPLMTEIIDSTNQDLFIVLHSYGSHFNYSERYPTDFQKFKPDNFKSVSSKHKEQLINAYDNSILYTDHFLSSTIDALKETNASVAMLYTSDHGEDLFDDDRNRFLHASPTPTYYQLRIPIIMWFSDLFVSDFENKALAAKANINKPINTSAVFHTLLDAGEIKTHYLDPDLSIIHPSFFARNRLYLNDHDMAIPYQHMNLKEDDFKMIKKNQLKK